MAQDPVGFWIVASIVALFTGVAGWLVYRKQQDQD
jgi:zinc transporter